MLGLLLGHLYTYTLNPRGEPSPTPSACQTTNSHPKLPSREGGLGSCACTGAYPRLLFLDCCASAAWLGLHELGLPFPPVVGQPRLSWVSPSSFFLFRVSQFGMKTTLFVCLFRYKVYNSATRVCAFRCFFFSLFFAFFFFCVLSGDDIHLLTTNPITGKSTKTRWCRRSTTCWWPSE